MIETNKIKIGPVEWFEDAAGPHWRAALLDEHGCRMAITGSYYDVEDIEAEKLCRPTREEQEEGLRQCYEIVPDGPTCEREMKRP